MPKKCRSRGAAIEESVETRPYEGVGLKGIILVGVTVRKCAACKEEILVIPRIEELHRLIALGVIEKPGPLTGAELRFLRKHLGHSGVEFAARLDLSPEHLSRAENGAKALSAMAERLVRLMVAHNDREADYSLDRLAAVPSEKAGPLRLKLRSEKGEWKKAA